MGVAKDGNERRLALMAREALQERHGRPGGPLVLSGSAPADAGGGASFLVRDEGGSHKTFEVIVREFRR